MPNADPGVVPIPEDLLAEAMAELGDPPAIDPAEAEAPEAEPQTEGGDQPEAEGDSGEAVDAEPNPEGDEPAAEAEPALHPVLQSLPEDLREGLAGLTAEQQELVAKVRGVYDKGLQGATQKAAEYEREALVLRSLVKDPAELRRVLAQARGEAPAAPEPSRRPRLGDFQDETDPVKAYDDATDAWEAGRDQRIAEQTQSAVAAHNPTVPVVKAALAEEGRRLGDDPLWQAAVQAYDLSICNDPAKVAALSAPTAIAGARRIYAAMGGVLPASPVRAPVRPNPAPRPAKAASVPARSSPSTPSTQGPEPWEKPGVDLDTRALGAWGWSGQKASGQGPTRAPSRGAPR